MSLRLLDHAEAWALEAKVKLNAALTYLDGLQASITAEIAAAIAALKAAANTWTALQTFEDGVILEDASPSSPPADSIIAFAKKFSRAWPAIQTEDGFAPLLQPMLGSSWKKFLLQPFASTTASVSSIGGAGTPSGTLSTPALASTDIRTRNSRVRATSAAGAGSLAGFSSNGAAFMRSTTTGAGGFRFEAIFSIATDATGFRLACGLTQLPLAALADPSSLLDIILVGYDAADTTAGNLIIMHNDGAGAATRVDSGIARNTTSLYRIIFDCVPGGGTIYWHLTNLVTGTTASGSLTTNLPTSDTLMGPRLEITNAAVASACAVELYIISVDGQIA